MDNIDRECERWINTYEEKWRLNMSFVENNFNKLREEFPGCNITIVDQKVRYAIPLGDPNAWKSKWYSLSRDEQLEAYSIYIKERNEVIVI
jgi:hypothetical protein